MKIQSDRLEKRHQNFLEITPLKTNMTGVWKIPRVLYEVHLQMVAVSSVMLVFLGVFFWSFFLKKQKMIPCFVVVKQMCSSTFRLAGGHCSVHKDHVKSWVFHEDLGYKLPKNNLHFKKEKKKDLLEKKIHGFSLFPFPPPTFTKTLQNIFPGGAFSMSHLLILLILHLVRRGIRKGFPPGMVYYETP